MGSKVELSLKSQYFKNPIDRFKEHFTEGERESMVAEIQGGGTITIRFEEEEQKLRQLNKGTIRSGNILFPLPKTIQIFSCGGRWERGSFHCQFFLPVKYVPVIFLIMLDQKVAVFHSKKTIVFQIILKLVWEKQMSNLVTEYFKANATLESLFK